MSSSTPSPALTKGFNPYFSGCFSLRGADNRHRHDHKTQFQSLFFWMLLSKVVLLCLGAIRGLSFNPYFSGCFSLSLPDNDVYIRVCSWFQSLFFWMLLSKNATSLRLKSSFLGFNPYFSGCFSLSIQYHRPIQDYNYCFNPYFSGCFSLRQFNIFHRFRKICRVSILIFLDASL